VTPCPLCGASFDPAVHLRWNKDGFDVVRCPSCALLFRSELPTTDELAEIYAVDYFKAGDDGDAQGYLDYVADESVHRLAARRRLRLLARSVRPGALLDVGAAAGFFVDEARARGWEARGIDVADSMLDWGRRELGASLSHATLADVEATPRSLDAVTMWDYIEHSLDPVADLERAHDLLRTGGALALSTGDADAAVARLSGSRWHLLTPRHHNYFFTETTLRRLLDQTGFDVVSLSHAGSRYPLAYLVHKTRTLVQVRALDVFTRRLADSPLGGIAVPVNLWDIATVVARRR
jgi:2-polyprenyl-3-methyl-5-hydroxy-6-metoxy-1,4-benzoquinol methylase